MQTVGHISGAAYFYGRHQLKNDPFPKNKVNNFFFVCRIIPFLLSKFFV